MFEEFKYKMKLPKFNKLWSNAKRSIFRLESLPKYRIAYDLKNFEKFKKGKKYLSQKETNWFKRIKRAKNKNIKIQRVRIFSYPISAYLRYEIDFWRHSAKFGEEILFLESKKYKKIKHHLKIKPKDFWLFDNKNLILFHYDKEWIWLKEEAVLKKVVIEKYSKLRNELIKNSVTMEKMKLY